LKKKQGKKKPGVTRLTRRVDPTRPDQKPGCNPLIFIFIFLLKQRYFNFVKKNLTGAIR
jgi:hypothetical protein